MGVNHRLKDDGSGAALILWHTIADQKRSFQIGAFTQQIFQIIDCRNLIPPWYIKVKLEVTKQLLDLDIRTVYMWTAMIIFT